VNHVGYVEDDRPRIGKRQVFRNVDKAKFLAIWNRVRLAGSMRGNRRDDLKGAGFDAHMGNGTAHEEPKAAGGKDEGG
jgi:hypothetical protein